MAYDPEVTTEILQISQREIARFCEQKTKSTFGIDRELCKICLFNLEPVSTVLNPIVIDETLKQLGIKSKRNILSSMSFRAHPPGPRKPSKRG